MRITRFRYRTSFVVAAAMVVVLFGPVASVQAANEYWTIGSYNIGSARYGGYITSGGVVANNVPLPVVTPPDIAASVKARSHWARRSVASSALSRKAWIGAQLARIIDWNNDNNVHRQNDVVAIQEAMPDLVYHTTLPPLMEQRVSLFQELTPRGYGFALSFSALDSKLMAGDQITVAASPQLRKIDHGSHLVFRTAAVDVLSIGSDTGRAYLNSAYKAGYLNALGTAFVNDAAVKSDKLFPRAVFRKTGASVTVPNKSLIMGSIHAHFKYGYTLNNVNDAYIRHFYNGYMILGLAQMLKGLSQAGSVKWPQATPYVVAGDANAHYHPSTDPTNSANVARSVPLRLEDLGMWDARSSEFPRSVNSGKCKKVVASVLDACVKYSTKNDGTSLHVIDYIFVNSTANPSLMNNFQTMPDDSRGSDHKMIAARIRIP